MPPTPTSSTQPLIQQPRVILYHQTHYHDGNFVSALPLLTEARSNIGPTHLILAALHLNASPGNITLNDDPPFCAKHEALWEEAGILNDVGVKVLVMLGGAAKGTFMRLDSDDDQTFESYYVPLKECLKTMQGHGLEGVDLDVEEEMSLLGIIRLIDRLKLDFGQGFLITMAPVANALAGGKHLSGFDYEALEVMRGGSVAWYNTQFYNGWGSVQQGFGQILARGWRPEKVVVGVLTNPGNGHDFVEFEELKALLRMVRQFCPNFGGVMGWEYFNCVPGGHARPWEWAESMRDCIVDCQ
ncbi:MAG: hypothetical protein Q9191_001637 [Dirinaria sp. TL-2023a]